MTRNGKLLTATGAVIAVVLAPVAALAGTNSPGAAHHPMTIHVVEHATTDTVQKFHPPNKSLSDVLGSTTRSSTPPTHGRSPPTTATASAPWRPG